ncbi:unnamed protein product [Clonostachys byssicola]|uniref:Uncharacterized protein n=1 Tax=Clonostachys byssicola TaxID=160290 RepID=A0A9N9U3Z2_9HYPO|nr:unnamed protein product [Clonostachys byssicola]
MILAVARSVEGEEDTASAESSDVLGQSGNSGGVKYAEQSVSDPRVRGFSRDEGRWSGSSLTTVGCRLKLTTLESTDQKGVSLAVVRTRLEPGNGFQRTRFERRPIDRVEKIHPYSRVLRSAFTGPINAKTSWELPRLQVRGSSFPLTTIPPCLSLPLLPPLPRHPSIIPLHPPQSSLDQDLLIHPIHLGINHARRTYRRLRQLLPPPILLLLLRLPRKERRYLHPAVHEPVPAEQAAVARPVPEAPPEADAVLPAEDELPAHLADGEVQQGRAAGFAGEAGGAAQDLRRAGRQAEAECACEEVGRRGGGHDRQRWTTKKWRG